MSRFSFIILFLCGAALLGHADAVEKKHKKHHHHKAKTEAASAASAAPEASKKEEKAAPEKNEEQIVNKMQNLEKELAKKEEAFKGVVQNAALRSTDHFLLISANASHRLSPKLPDAMRRKSALLKPIQ